MSTMNNNLLKQQQQEQEEAKLAPRTDWTLPAASVKVQVNVVEMPQPQDDDDEVNDAEVGISTDGTKYAEWMMPGLKLEMNLKQILASEQSAFQKVEILDTFFGKTLVLDGYTQSSQFDEYVYHESLVHPAMARFTATAGRGPQRVFIGGGGELATAREVLQWPSVERVVMVDLDETVVRLCRDYLAEWGGVAVATDPRLELHFGDAHEYLINYNRNNDATATTATPPPFDVMIMDISDPVEAGPGLLLYTSEFYQHAATLLSADGGVFVTQAGAADATPYHIPQKDNSGTITNTTTTTCMSFGPIRNTLAQVFGQAWPYSVHIASFGGDWGFVMACRTVQQQEKDNDNRTTTTTTTTSSFDWKQPRHEFIDGLMDRYIKGGAQALRHYDGESHQRMFALPKSLRQYLKTEDRIMTKDNPIYTF